MRSFRLSHHLYLIGARCTGKSTVGKLLAQRLDLCCRDMDWEIQNDSGMSISEIFSVENEIGFRKRESRILSRIVDEPVSVVSTGGGVVLHKENRDLLRASGRCVWLTASPQVLWERALGDPMTQSIRPALGPEVEDPVDGIRRILSIRAPLYQELADWTVDTERKGPEEICDEILAAMSIDR